MMNALEYAETIRQWCAEVETTANELFATGVHPQECTGLAINLVESRRKKKGQEQAALTPPPGMRIRGH
jgi:hypothetical protein